MEIDLGGDLTFANRQLVQRAVMMSVMAEVGGASFTPSELHNTDYDVRF